MGRSVARIAPILGLRPSDAGQAMVELALLLPLLLFGLLGGADMARAYAAQQATQNAARAGAEATVLDVATSDTETIEAARSELGGAAGVDADAATITVAHTTEDTVDYVTVRVRYTWRTIVPWPFVPNTVFFDRSTQMRKVS